MASRKKLLAFNHYSGLTFTPALQEIKAIFFSQERGNYGKKHFRSHFFLTLPRMVRLKMAEKNKTRLINFERIFALTFFIEVESSSRVKRAYSFLTVHTSGLKIVEIGIQTLLPLSFGFSIEGPAGLGQNQRNLLGLPN